MQEGCPTRPTASPSELALHGFRQAWVRNSDSCFHLGLAVQPSVIEQSSRVVVPLVQASRSRAMEGQSPYPDAVAPSEPWPLSVRFVESLCLQIRGLFGRWYGVLFTVRFNSGDSSRRDSKRKSLALLDWAAGGLSEILRFRQFSTQDCLHVQCLFAGVVAGEYSRGGHAAPTSAGSAGPI